MVGLERDNVASLREAAELLHLPRSTVSELARRGQLPARKVGRRWVFLRDLLHAALLPDGHPDAWRPRHDERPARSTSPGSDRTGTPANEKARKSGPFDQSG